VKTYENICGKEVEIFIKNIEDGDIEGVRRRNGVILKEKPKTVSKKPIHISKWFSKNEEIMNFKIRLQKLRKTS
jgi:hypothetical protein